MLRRMIRDGAPPEWSPLMRLVASEIADDAHDPDGKALPSADDWPDPWASMPIEGEYRHGAWRDGLTEVTGMSARAVSRTLADLAAAGYDMRAPITDRDGRPVRDRRGRLVYAAKGHAVRFTIPHLPPRGKPQRSPEVASDAPQPVEDRDSSPEVASISDRATGVGDGESLPDSASIWSQRSPLLVPKVATFGDPFPSASPNVKTVPQAAAARTAEDQEQPQDQEQPITKSQDRRLRNGPGTVADDAQHFSRNDSESTTAGTGARARHADTPAA